MSTPGSTPSPNPAQAPSTAGSGTNTGASNSAPPAGTVPQVPPAPAEWRASTNAPEWARGKTAEEVLGIAQQLYSTVEGFTQGRGAPSAPAPQYAPPAAPPNPAPPAPAWNADDYMTGRDLERVAPQFVQQYVQPQIQDLVNMTADGNYHAVRQKFAKEFDRYGPAILNTLGMLPKNAWSIANLEKAVKLALVDTTYVDDLARERAERVIAEMGPTLRSSAGAGSIPVSPQHAEYTLQSEKLPTEWKERAAKVGLSEQALDEFCHANGMTREDWFKQFEKTAITEVTRRG